MLFLGTLSQHNIYNVSLFSPHVYFTSLIYYLFCRSLRQKKKVYEDIFLQVFKHPCWRLARSCTQTSQRSTARSRCSGVFHQDSHRSSLRSELENSLMSPLPRPPNKKGKNTHTKMLKTHLQMSASDQDFSPALMFFFFT